MKLFLLWDYRAREYKRTLSWIKDDERVYFVNLELNERVISYDNDGFENSANVVELKRRSNATESSVS